MESWRRALARLKARCRERPIDCVIYAVWLALLVASSPNWIPAIRVYRGEPITLTTSSPPVILLDYEYKDGILKLKFYRTFAWCSKMLVEVRVTTSSGDMLYVKERVLPSRIFTVTFSVKAGEATVEVLLEGEPVLKTRLVLTD